VSSLYSAQCCVALFIVCCVAIFKVSSLHSCCVVLVDPELWREWERETVGLLGPSQSSVSPAGALPVHCWGPPSGALPVHCRGLQRERGSDRRINKYLLPFSIFAPTITHTHTHTHTNTHKHKHTHKHTDVLDQLNTSGVYVLGELCACVYVVSVCVYILTWIWCVWGCTQIPFKGSIRVHLCMFCVYVCVCTIHGCESMFA
jgi:hypothetical protein